MPYMSVVVPTMRVGGLDVLMESLSRQTFQDFELVLVDGLHSLRSSLIQEHLNHYKFPIRYIAPVDNPFPLNSYCRYVNSGLSRASGEIVLFAVDYTWFGPTVLETHAAFHRADVSKKAGLMSPHAYLKLPPVSPAFHGYGRAGIEAYYEDLGSRKLNGCMWSLFQSHVSDPAIIAALTPDDPLLGEDPKLHMPAGPIASEYFHAKNESCRLEHVLAIHGCDEDLDGTHGWQDSDLAGRLTAHRGIEWTLNPANKVHIVNPRSIFPFARRNRGIKSNEDLWLQKKAAGYPEINNSILLQREPAPLETLPKIVKSFAFKGHSYKIMCTEEWPKSLAIPDLWKQSHPSWYSFEDESSVRDSKWRIEPGDCIFDIGAAFGSYTLTALAAGAAYAVVWSPQGVQHEADREADYVRASLKLNGWEDRAEVHAFGFFTEDGWLDARTQEFFRTEPKLKTPDLLPVKNFDSWAAPKIPWFKNNFSSFWFKFDVEGAEMDILRTATKAIAALRPKILIENHNFKRATLEQEVREFLIGLGYTEVETTPYLVVSHSLYFPSPI